jgi:hypothetical protein
MNSYHSVEDHSLNSSLTAEELAGIDRRYSDSVLALSSYDSLIEQGCSPLAAEEILQILKSDPDVCSDITNGHWIASDDLEADEAHIAAETVNTDDPMTSFETATQSCLHRYDAANDLFVADNAAWVKGFNPAAFERHVERTRKARRYHGIEDIVFDKAGRVRSVRKLIKKAA